MKNLVIILVLAITFLSSCEKEVTPIPTPTTTAALRDIHIDYAINCTSGDLEVVYYVKINGRMVERTENVQRLSHTISFDASTQEFMSVKARNSHPSYKEVLVSIYVDGVLFKSASTTTAGAWATAAGTPQ